MLYLICFFYYYSILTDFSTILNSYVMFYYVGAQLVIWNYFGGEVRDQTQF